MRRNAIAGGLLWIAIATATRFHWARLTLDAIVHQIHMRVFQHIKRLAEAANLHADAPLPNRP